MNEYKLLRTAFLKQRNDQKEKKRKGGVDDNEEGADDEDHETRFFEATVAPFPLEVE